MPTTAVPRHAGFLGDVLTLASGATLAQAVSILAAPIVARYFGPAAFGAFALYAGLVSVIGDMSSAGYGPAVVVASNDDEAASLFAGSLALVAITAALTAGATLYVVALYDGPRQLPPELRSVAWLLPLSVLLAGSMAASRQWLARKRRFGAISAAGVVGSVSTSSTQIGAGALGLASGPALIVTSVLGQLAMAPVLLFRVWAHDGAHILRSVGWKTTPGVLRAYRKFPLFDVWSTLLNTASWQAPVFLLAYFFTATETGYYSFGNRVLMVPLGLVGSSIAQVFYQRAAVAGGDGTLPAFVEGIFRRFTFLGLCPLLAMALCGDDVFAVVFGQRWREAGVYAQVLSPWMFFWLISSPLSSLFYVLRRQGFLLLLNIAILGTRVAALAVGGAYQSVHLAVGLFAASGVIVYGYLSLAVLAASDVPWSRAAGILGRGLLAFLPVGLVILGARRLGAPPLAVVCVAAVSVAAYYAALARMSPDILRGLAPGRETGAAPDRRTP